MNKAYPDKFDRELIEAFSKLKSEKEITAFLRDLLTFAEIKEASRRFHIAKMLWTGKQSYLEIARKIKTSTTTVTRVADWLFNQPHRGYFTVLSRLFPKN